MDCQEARRAVGAVMEGTYEVTKLDDFIWHVENCESCREELAAGVYLQKSLDAFDSNADYPDLEEEVYTKELLSKLRERIRRYEKRVRFFAILDTMTIWAVALTIALQIIYWVVMR